MKSYSLAADLAFEAQDVDYLNEIYRQTTDFTLKNSIEKQLEELQK